MKRFENINLAESHCIAIDRFNRCDFLPSSLFCLLPSLFHLRPLINDPFQTLKQLCIVPKNPLISRFLSRVNFFKKPVWRKCVPRYLVYPILRLSLDGWLLWKKKEKKRRIENTSRKNYWKVYKGDMIRRMKLLGHFQFSSFSLPLSLSPLFLFPPFCLNRISLARIYETRQHSIGRDSRFFSPFLSGIFDQQQQQQQQLYHRFTRVFV